MHAAVVKKHAKTGVKKHAKTAVKKLAKKKTQKVKKHAKKGVQHAKKPLKVKLQGVKHAKKAVKLGRKEVAVKVHEMLESAQKLERFSKMPMPIEAEQSVLIADQQTVKGKAHAKVKLVPSMAAKEKKLKARVKHAEHMVKKTNAVAKKVEGL